MIYKVLINVMDEAYADYSASEGNIKERVTLDSINELTPLFESQYDAFIDLRQLSSVTEKDRDSRILFLEDRLSDIRRTLVENQDKGEEVSLYLHFVGHGGHGDGIDEIQHIHYDYLFPKLLEFFGDYEMSINLLGTCNSYYAKNYLKRGTLLCCTKSTVDYLSPFQYTSLGYYKTNDIEGFKEKCGNSGGYEMVNVN